MKKVQVPGHIAKSVGARPNQVDTPKPPPAKPDGTGKAAEMAARAALSTSQIAAAMLSATEHLRDAVTEMRAAEKEEPKEKRKVRLVVKRDQRGLIDYVEVEYV